MAATNNQYLSYLDPNQEDLLTAALNSNNLGNTVQNGTSHAIDQQLANQFSFDGLDPSLFMNQNNLALNGFNQTFAPMEESPFLDYADDDGNLDYEFNDADGEMIGGLPDDDYREGDIHEKRKSLGSDQGDNENGAKRREGDSKEPKKPGRKPLTSEPTTKRKAQNRAAQRAFRERKEKHLKDLETKVEELEKESEATNHENGLLRAQVQRMQIELREYRKRLSMNNGLLGRSPPVGNMNFLANSANDVSNNFQFEFPKFGSLPGGIFANPGKATSTADSNVPQRSTTRAISPHSQARADSLVPSGSNPHRQNSVVSSTGSPDQARTNGSSISSTFFPSMGAGAGVGFDNWVTMTKTAEPESTNNVQNVSSRIFQFNSGSNSAHSPVSSSSTSQDGGGANSSCGTSPEPSHNSPKTGNLNTIAECGTIQTTEGEVSFCEKLNMACGNIRDPVPRSKSLSNGTPGATAEQVAIDPTSNENFSAFGELASQNGGGFDPLLFDTYREPQSAIVGDGGFTGGFFNDALPPMDLTSPFDWADITAPTGLTPSVSRNNPLGVADALQSGADEEEVVPADSGPLLTCHKIWDKLQNRTDFKDGSLDIDNLCSELRAKARCSESGVVIDQKDVDHALKRLSPTIAPRV